MKILHSKNYLGFTLVELIVVITILAILGTIAFVSLGGFTSSARDSGRISNLSNLKKGLDVFQVKTDLYPTPENYTTLTMSGKEVIYQGFAKDQTVSLAKVSPGATLDPTDSSMYTTYAVTVNKKKIQLMAFLENGNIITAFPSFIPTLYASNSTDYSKRYPYVIGDDIGILRDSTGTLAPVQETIGTGSIDIGTTATGYTVYFDSKVSTSGTGKVLKRAFLIGSVVYNSGSTSTGTWIVATGGIVTVSGNYKIHTFTNVGTSAFQILSGVGDVEYLVVAGGGGGGAGDNSNWWMVAGGGGGGGGMLTGTLVDLYSGSYPVTVGQGGKNGVYGSSPTNMGSNGGDSVFWSLVSIGGGGGSTVDIGKNGGSGGGGGNNLSGGSGTTNQGKSGGKSNVISGYYIAGGGGGAGGSGDTGGMGLMNSISGSPFTYAGGGSGGGTGGGNGFTGSANTGNGGGGAGIGFGLTGSPGGSGIVIVRYQYQ